MFEIEKDQHTDVSSKVLRACDDFLQTLDSTECDTATMAMEFSARVGEMNIVIRIQMSAEQAAPF